MDKAEYMDFLQSKRLNVMPSGFGVKMSDLPPQMKDWQALITRWALRRGYVVMLDGWEKSSGAGDEFQLGLTSGKHVFLQDDYPDNNLTSEVRRIITTPPA